MAKYGHSNMKYIWGIDNDLDALHELVIRKCGGSKYKMPFFQLTLCDLSDAESVESRVISQCTRKVGTIVSMFNFHYIL